MPINNNPLMICRLPVFFSWSGPPRWFAVVIPIW